jgi:serine/threonine protein kinase
MRRARRRAGYPAAKLVQHKALTDFGPFRIVRQIAVGGMAEIYLARQRGVSGIERMVVLKRILERYAGDAEFITMFLDEARLMAALSHPNIAQVFDVGEVDGTSYLVMEHVRGPTLGKLLAAAREAGTGGLPRREALGIAMMVAEALHYVHERKDELGRPLSIVHRDLNPANVMVSYDGAVKLIDFGIAKAATKVYETRAGVIKGTYGYIAPEALTGTKPVDRRADVFALGILLYELCVGDHPYDVSDEPNLIQRIVEARYRRPSEVRRDVPKDLDRIIAACLAPSPEGRPADVAEVIDGLAKHLGEQRMVPTQHAIAKLVSKLVPDEEGPRPLKALTSPNRPRPLDAATRNLRIDGVEKPATESDVWSVETQRLGGDPREVSTKDALSLPLSSESPLAQDDALETLLRKDDHKKISEEDEEVATTLMPMPSLPQAPAPVPIAKPRKLPQPKVDSDQTWVPLSKSAQPFPRLVLVPIAVGGVLFAAAVGFAAARMLQSDDDVPSVASPAAPAETSPQPHELRVVSEPAGAEVWVDGRSSNGRTPLLVTLPAETREVWLRLAKDGYVDQERRVSTSIGEARFVLRSRGQ